MLDKQLDGTSVVNKQNLFMKLINGEFAPPIYPRQLQMRSDERKGTSRL